MRNSVPDAILRLQRSRSEKDHEIQIRNSATERGVRFMKLTETPCLAKLPTPFLLTLALAGSLMIFAAWDQSYWWRTNEDYSFGWLVPFFVVYVMRDRWPELVARQSAPDREAPKASALWALVPPIAGAALPVGSLLFLGGAFYRSAAGATHLSSQAITLGMCAITLSSIFFMAPSDGSAAPEDRARGRLSVASLFAFPVLVWSISAPMLSSVENRLSLYLGEQITGIVFYFFDLLGLTLVRNGNVLLLPSGNIGVEEACSGIRSLTGCLFAGCFFAAVFVRAWWRKMALVGSSLLFAFVANLLRSLFLTAWAYRYGAKSIEGSLHDLSGYLVLLLAVLALFCVLPFVDESSRKTQETGATRSRACGSHPAQ